jgi:exopolysaccharide production protein ExoQ
LMQRDVMADVLGALGKDSTLTGRTMMWEIARREMAEHPWTGLGPEGFWNWNTGIAHNLVTEQFGIGFNGQYSFHNSYYQNGVDYGYPGFFATVFLATWTLSSAALTWIRNQSVVNATFLMIAAMVILRSNSESDLGGVFGSTVVLLYIAAARKEFGKRSLADAVRSFTTRVRP